MGPWNASEFLQYLHQLHVAVWVLRRVRRKLNKCVGTGRNYVQGPQSQPTPERTSRYGTHFKRGDDAEVVISTLESAEKVWQTSD